MIDVYIDGACKPNPGSGAIGVTIRGNGHDFSFGKKVQDKCDSYRAEFLALIHALDFLKQYGLENDEITIHSDSLVLVNQMNDDSKCYSPIHGEAVILGCEFKHVNYVWVPREQNAEANMLAVKAFKIPKGQKRAKI